MYNPNEHLINNFMSSLYKSLGTLLVTAVIGSVSFLISTPGKIIKNKVNHTKTSTQKGLDEKENLFI